MEELDTTCESLALLVLLRLVSLTEDETAIDSFFEIIFLNRH